MAAAVTANDRHALVPLLRRGTPHHRLAYSDRTAWLLAYLAELAYHRFNPRLSERQRALLLQQVEAVLDDERTERLERLLEDFAYDSAEAMAWLKADLKALDAELLATFDRDGTQAILVSAQPGLILAFRGTEATSLADIKADVDAVSVPCPSGGRVHRGFRQAYDRVAGELQAALADHADRPLLICGHSLGGALATVAAKSLHHPAGLAACYTYGSPRVGDADWVDGMKTPLYRMVNAADCVTLLPPGSLFIGALAWLVKWIPGPGRRLSRWLHERFGGYLHGGHMRYLTNCPTGDYTGVRLLYSVSLLYRLKAFWLHKLPLRRFLADHSISVYRRKLGVVALRRNPDVT